MMVKIVAVDRERHAGKGCRRAPHYSFAATQALTPLVGAEFAQAAVAMPMAFIEHSGRYLPVAVMSPVQGRNFFVSPTGQWLGNYVPAGLRSYPFSLVREGSDNVALCIDEDSGWVVDTDGEAADSLRRMAAPQRPSRRPWNFFNRLNRAVGIPI